jgi:hypothetical protein
MEFYGSIDSVSGSITASLFTGSFKGDGGGLYNLPASGVTGLNLSQIASGNATASISSTGFTVNKSTQIQGDLSVTGSIIATNYIVSSSVTYMTTSFASGSSMFGNDGNDVHQFTGSVQITGSISLNGQAIGTGKLDETTFQSYTSSISSSIGSLSSSIALTDVSQSNRLTTIEGNYATTGSNLFKGSQTISGSIIPSVDNTYDLGSVTHQWKDVYISSGSLYIDGTKVLGSTSQELTITTDTGQSIKILEAGSDSIILQSADGDIELKSSGGGDILFDPTNGIISIKGTTQIQDGFKITSSGGNSIVFGDAVIVSGSIDLTGNVDGIDLQSFSSSVSTSISSLLGGNTSLSSSIATTTSGLSSSIGSLSSSVAITTSGLTSTITSVSSSLTSSIGSLSSSVATTTFSLSSSIESLSSSVATTTSGLTSTITSLSSSLTSSIGSISSSINSTIGLLSSSVSTSIGGLSSSVATTTSELSSSIGSLSSSIATTTISAKNRVDSIETTTGSLNTFSSSINTTIKSKLDIESVISGSVQVVITGTTGYSTFSSSVSTSIGALSSSVSTTTSDLSSSIGSLSSSVATTTSGLSSSVAITTSGLSSSIGSLSSSIATTTLETKNRVDSIESKTGSYATTGSNIFQGSQTITGSLYISQDLIVAGSSSIQNISSSILNIGDNIITVNALNPSVRFGGLAVIDSGSSPQVSGSMLFDSVNDQWIFIHQNQSSVTSSILLMGPQTFNNVGNEAFPTNNRLLKSVNAEHLGDSNVSDDGTTVTILSNAIVNGTFSSTGTTLVSGSSQITHDSTTGYVANRHIDHTAVSISAGNGLSGGGDISTTRTLTLDTGSVHFLDGVKKELNTEGVISGSSQILAGTTIHSGSFFNGISVVSGSAQVSFNGITDKPTLVSGSSQVSFNGITDKPTLVSGSSQITYGSISSIPSGIVSGSGQIDLTATTNYASGILTRLNAVGVFSGSAQVDLTATTNYASGILTRLNAVGVFSGSAQVTLSSTTGYGSVLNQAVLTTSSPTFSAVSATTFTGALSGNASTASSTPTLSASGTLTTQAGSGTLIHSSPIVSSETGLFSTGDNSNSIITFNRHPGNYYSQLGFNSTGTIFYRSFNNTAINTSQAWKTIIDSSNIGSQSVTYATTAGALTSMNISQFTNNSGYITGISFANVSSKPTTLSGYGITDALNNTVTSEQTIGFRYAQINNSDKTIKFDPRWNESTYDADLGTLHIYSTTAAGANYGRAGIALYNGSAYQYLTTKASTTGLFANNSLIATAGSTPTFAGVNGSSYFDAQASSGFRIRNSNDTANAGGYTRRGLWEGNANYDPALWAETGYGLYFYTNGSGTPKTVITTNGAFLHGHTAAPDVNAWLGTAVFGVSGYNKVIIGSLNSTTTGAYIGGHNSALSAWADINVAGEAIIFRYQQTERARFDTSGHFIPGANNTYDLGSASLGWRNVYTNDLHLSNMNKPEGNDVDGTNGNWTIQEGAEQLYIINNNNGKKFKIDLTEII